MQNQFKPHPTALFNGQPVLEYYYLHGADHAYHAPSP